MWFGAASLLKTTQMLLWTYQGVDHSLTDGRIDSSRLPYLEDVKGYEAAIKELAKRIEPTGQIIWCFTTNAEWLETQPERDKYTLEVAPSHFLRVIDNDAWHRILGRPVVWDSLRNRWMEEWNPDDGCWSDFYEMRAAEYRTLSPPKGTWWDSLLIEDPTTELSIVLLKHPIPESWIVSRERYISPICAERRAMKKPRS